MKWVTLICPVSTEKIDKNVARIGATSTAVLLGIYAYLVGSAHDDWGVIVIAFIVLDYIIRVFIPGVRPPISYFAGLVARLFRLGKKQMDKAPKMFAWRVGFLFAVASLVLFPDYADASAIVALALLGFNVLDGVFNFCVGCVIYTYVILPMMNARPRTQSSG